MAAKSFPVGSTVRLTGDFLRSTGQIAGGEGQSTWTVVEHPACDLCRSGRFVAVDQVSEYSGQPRHIAAGNLEPTRRRS